MADKKYYTVNAEKRVITIDDAVKGTKTDEKEIQMYIMGGYTIRHKSEKRVLTAKERADKEKDKFSKEKIEETLKKYPDLEKTYLEIKKGRDKGHGYFAAKSWYKEKALPIIEAKESKK